MGDLIREKSDESIRESLGDREEVLAEYLISRNRSFQDLPGNIPLSVCAETVDGEFAGFISGGVFETGISRRLVAVANIIWVEKKFRGMGITRHLIDDFSKNAITRKAERIIFDDLDEKVRISLIAAFKSFG